MPSEPRTYRSNLLLIQLILEQLIKAGNEGMVKTMMYAELGLKTAIGEKYMDQLLKASYITINEEPFGKERTRQIVQITPLGRQRFEWFIKLSKELNV
jgi:predicted transcriptional regulator